MRGGGGWEVGREQQGSTREKNLWFNTEGFFVGLALGIWGCLATGLLTWREEELGGDYFLFATGFHYRTGE